MSCYKGAHCGNEPQYHSKGDPGHGKLATEVGVLWEYFLSKAIPHHALKTSQDTEMNIF